ncbi:MAG: hypothetical protein L6Q54_10295 [Leptospiraceae bacterium]|nr:hypothetical protein [Leptospiraceae bacterium]MCK6381617.1 hypothetical protein [Leptospiraceae bacterium]NUM41150.1 hypothetical protein [Leptospiraceae bacterium]
MRILVYGKEYEERIREGLSGYLSNFVSDIKELESMLQKENFDLIVLKYNAATLDFLDSLKKNYEKIQFPLILSISQNKENNLDRIDDFLTEDFTAKELSKRLSILEEKSSYFRFLSEYKNSSLEEIEKFLILSTVEKEKGSKSKAAKILGISTRTIELKFHKWGITSREDKV